MKLDIDWRGMLRAIAKASLPFLTGALAGCAVENMTVHNFRTMGMDGDSAAAVSAVVDKLAE